MKIKSLICLISLLVLIASVGAGQQLPQNLRDYVTENYTKREVSIPMRDGVRLFTVVYEPKDQSQKYPAMLNRTIFSVFPYGKDQAGHDLYKPSQGLSPSKELIAKILNPA